MIIGPSYCWWVNKANLKSVQLLMYFAVWYVYPAVVRKTGFKISSDFIKNSSWHSSEGDYLVKLPVIQLYPSISLCLCVSGLVLIVSAWSADLLSYSFCFLLPSSYSHACLTLSLFFISPFLFFYVILRPLVPSGLKVRPWRRLCLITTEADTRTVALQNKHTHTHTCTFVVDTFTCQCVEYSELCVILWSFMRERPLLYITWYW